MTSTGLVCVLFALGATLISWRGWMTTKQPSEAADIPGHLQPLGSHRSPISDGVNVLYDFPNPYEFFRHYLRPGKPAIFKSLASMMPAYLKWTDDYLGEKFGNVTVTVETNKKENRRGSVKDMTISEFLKIYSKEEIYLVGSATYEMLSDFSLPRSLLCTSFLKVLNDAVIWLSSGGTKSVLHYDELDNINCLLHGEKDFFLVDKNEESHIGITNHAEAYLPVDVDKVDMNKFPGLKNVPWYNVTLHAGDCLFIPYKWFHQVRSRNGRNLAINLWFVHLHWVDESECNYSTSDKPLTISFDKMDFCLPEECLRAELIGFTNGTDSINIEMFKNIFMHYTDSLTSLEKAFENLDQDSSGELSLKELYTANPDEMLSMFPKFGRKK